MLLSICAMTSSSTCCPSPAMYQPIYSSNVMPTGSVLRMPRLSSEKLVAAVCAQSSVPLETACSISVVGTMELVARHSMVTRPPEASTIAFDRSDAYWYGPPPEPHAH